MRPQAHKKAAIPYILSLPSTAGIATHTINSIFAAWAVLLSEYQGSPNVILWTDFFPREQRQDGKTPHDLQVDRDLTVGTFLESIEGKFETTKLCTSLHSTTPDTEPLRPKCRFSITTSLEPENSAPGDLATLGECAVEMYHEISSDNGWVSILSMSDKLDELQVERFGQQFEHTLNQVRSLTCLNSKLQDLETVSTTDRADLIRWNGDLPENVYECVHELIQVVVSFQSCLDMEIRS